MSSFPSLVPATAGRDPTAARLRGPSHIMGRFISIISVLNAETTRADRGLHNPKKLRYNKICWINWIQVWLPHELCWLRIHHSSVVIQTQRTMMEDGTQAPINHVCYTTKSVVQLFTILLMHLLSCTQIILFGGKHRSTLKNAPPDKIIVEYLIDT